ncbi:beta-propeller fold lactonase family protein [Acidobacteria bacterium AH-259-D05]|nr:beta-propeller fold lactonase family protein [Acidobacteria bacterium AH-259-D05]
MPLPLPSVPLTVRCTIAGALAALLGFAGLGGGDNVVAREAAETAGEQRPIILNKVPVRVIQDPYPTFNGIGMDVERGEVIMTDDNRASILAYGSEFKPTDRPNEPLRRIEGPKTHLGYICALAISPEAKEIYTVDNDWKDNMSVYPLDADGEVAPLRELNVDHGSRDISLDRQNDELLITTQGINKVSAYRRTADGDEEPLRFIQGPNTGLADPHGIFVDTENNEIFVANHGNWHKEDTGENAGTHFFGKRAKLVPGAAPRSRSLGPSTGKFLLPSITVYSRTAEGDADPVRTIQGSKTRLNWPNGIYLDPLSGQIVVANSGDDSILFFDRNANGDVAPVRVIQGPNTGLDGPSGVFIDTQRNDLWVTNWDNHTATLYPRMAEGDVAPLRTIRGAPANVPRATGFGNPGHVIFDPKRKEILVPD